MIFVMIAGASASGKTAISQILLAKLRRESRSCQLINMDNYYEERDELKYPNIDLFRQEPKFYLPTHLSLQQLCDDLVSLTQGQSVYQKTFDFESNLYKKNELGELVLEKINPSDIIIMEGLFSQYFANEFLPIEYPRISVNVANSSYLNIMKARLKRDTASPPLGRNFTEEQVRVNECKFVGPVFFQYTAKNATGSDIYILNDHDNENINDEFFEKDIQTIIEEINKTQQIMESKPYSFIKRPQDALQMAKESQEMLAKELKEAQKIHPKHDIIEQMKKRSKTFGPFFKSAIMEEEGLNKRTLIQMGVNHEV